MGPFSLDSLYRTLDDLTTWNQENFQKARISRSFNSVRLTHNLIIPLSIPFSSTGLDRNKGQTKKETNNL